METQDVIILLLVLGWPVLVFAPLIQIATVKKWCSYDTLAVISGLWTIPMMIYYSFIFGILDFWVTYAITPIFALVFWRYMKELFDRRAEKEARQDKLDT